MISVGVRQLRQRASELLRLVEQGETVEITDRGRPVALLTPMPAGSPLERLRAAGEIDSATADLDDLPEPLVLPVALRRYLRRRRPLVSSSLARTEVIRALLPGGTDAVGSGQKVLTRIDLVRISNRVLDDAAALLPASIRSLDAVHLATAGQLGQDLGVIVTYDDRMADAARSLGHRVETPR